MTVDNGNNKKLLQGGLNRWVSESVNQWVSGSVGQKVRRVEGERLRNSEIRLKASKPGMTANSNGLSNNQHPGAYTADMIHLKKPSVGPKGLIGPPCHGVMASVIVCTFNRAQLLARLLESLSCQTAPVDTFEIIVVDDGSGDNTMEVCRRMMERMPNLKYLAMESNSGLGAAGNRGAAAARGQYLLFTDDDCIPDPGWVEKMCAVLRDSPLVAGAMVSPRSNYFKLCHNIAQFYPFMPGQKAQKLDFIAGANMGIQANTIDEIGVFNTGTTIPDMEYILRARQGGFTITYAPEAVITHDPQRVTLGSVLAYAAAHAAETILLRHRFRELLRTPLVLFSPVSILLAAPVIAFKTTAGIYLGNRKLLRCFHTIPLVYLIKLAWCWGAARGLLSEKKNHE